MNSLIPHTITYAEISTQWPRVMRMLKSSEQPLIVMDRLNEQAVLLDMVRARSIFNLTHTKPKSNGAAALLRSLSAITFKADSSLARNIDSYLYD